MPLAAWVAIQKCCAIFEVEEVSRTAIEILQTESGVKWDVCAKFFNVKKKSSKNTPRKGKDLKWKQLF